MHIDFLRNVFEEHSKDDAFVWKDSGYSYAWLLEQMDQKHAELDAHGIEAASTVVLHGDFNPYAVATMLCLIERSTIVIPVAHSSESKAAEFARIAEAQFELRFDSDWKLAVEATPRSPLHPLQQSLRERRHPGLVLFSSGSSGDPKGVVHDLCSLLKKYQTKRQCHRTLAFLLFDHIGGVDTAFYNLSNGSCMIFSEDRSPDAICAAVEKHRVGVLPVAPSFLNLLWISKAYARHDLSSLAIVTYGAEMMPENTLAKCSEMFPGVTIMQKYGTSEVGTLRSKSRSNDSLWLRIGGEGYETRVVAGMLEIKAESSMLGYLNAESPFTDDGWFRTGDCVETDGEYIRFLGRDSDLINVGGQKVYPAEVEGVISSLDNIREVAVHGETNNILGQIVCARVRTLEAEDAKNLSRRIRKACRSELENYKVPVKIEISETPLTSSRFKLMRKEER